MPRTANLRRQHDAAVILINDIARLSERLAQPGVAYEAALKLAKLAGMLRIHFAQEDQTLYPYMIASNNASTAATAISFRDEMGGLSEAFEAFVGRWSSADSIAAGAEQFRRDSREVFHVLAQRIERENAILYPLADSAADEQLRRSA